MYGVILEWIQNIPTNIARNQTCFFSHVNILSTPGCLWSSIYRIKTIYNIYIIYTYIYFKYVIIYIYTCGGFLKGYPHIIHFSRMFHERNHTWPRPTRPLTKPQCRHFPPGAPSGIRKFKAFNTFRINL